MDKPITAIDQVTPAWLTERMRCRGILKQGEVKEVRVELLGTNFNSNMVRLEVEYSHMEGDLPAHFFLKLSKPDVGERRVSIYQLEVAFYNEVAPRMAEPPVVRCFDAVFDPATNQSHVLIEDVGHSHFQDLGLPPLRADCERVIDCYSKLHAFWWDHPQLGTEVGTFPAEDNVVYTQSVAAIEEDMVGFADRVGERLTKERVRLYEKALRALPGFKDLRGQRRLAPGNRLTLIHGDGHYANNLLPKDPTACGVCLIDWQDWEIRVGTDDMARQMALLWYPDRRAHHEQELLRRYHDGLMRHGVEDYRWEDCWHDYRLSAIRNIFMPFFFWAVEVPMGVCWGVLEMSLLSFHDLNCAELLDS